MEFLMGMLALDTARERQRHGERLAHLFPDGVPRRQGGARRSLARAAAALSVVSASVARRLDEHVALTDAPQSRGA